MTRNLKIAGLALVAALAMGALAASVTQGEAWESEGEGEDPEILYVTGTQISHEGKSLHVISVTGRNISCLGLSFSGKMPGKGTNELKLTPSFKECGTEGGQPVTITRNGCEFVLFGGNMKKEDHITGGTLDLVCPEEVKHMDIHIYGTPANHEAKTVMCTVTIPAQGALDEVTYTNTKNEFLDVDATTEITKMATEVHGNKLLCGEKKQDATYTGSTTIRTYVDKTHLEEWGLSAKVV